MSPIAIIGAVLYPGVILGWLLFIIYVVLHDLDMSVFYSRMLRDFMLSLLLAAFLHICAVRFLFFGSLARARDH